MKKIVFWAIIAMAMTAGCSSQVETTPNQINETIDTFPEITVTTVEESVQVVETTTTTLQKPVATTTTLPKKVVTSTTTTTTLQVPVTTVTTAPKPVTTTTTLLKPVTTTTTVNTCGTYVAWVEPATPDLIGLTLDEINSRMRLFKITRDAAVASWYATAHAWFECAIAQSPQLDTSQYFIDYKKAYKL